MIKKSAILLFLIICHSFGYAQTKIAEYGTIPSDDELTYIDKLATAIQNNPNSKAYIIIHRGGEMPLGTFARRFYDVQRMWTDGRKYDSKDLVMLAGEETKDLSTELWLIPEGAKIPDIKLISLEETLKVTITDKILFDFLDCLECGNDPPRDLSLLGDNGLKFYAEALKANPNSRALILLNRISQVKEVRNKLTREFGIDAKRIKIQIKRTPDRYYTMAKFYIIPLKTNL